MSKNNMAVVSEGEKDVWNASGVIISLTVVFVSVCLRIQSNVANKLQFKGISPERAFADFIFASLILHLVVMNFIGWGAVDDYRTFLWKYF